MSACELSSVLVVVILVVVVAMVVLQSGLNAGGFHSHRSSVIIFV